MQLCRMSDTETIRRIIELAELFAVDAISEFDASLASWKFDMARNTEFEVIGALLARQTTLAVRIARTPQVWNDHVAPILLRSMADVHITICWALESPEERCPKFVEYGIGQLKLNIEHVKNVGDAGVEPGAISCELPALEDWLEGQKARYFIDVNVGSMSGDGGIHKMAKDCGCKEFYDLHYSPLSGCAHSMWQCIGRLNLTPCTNPLHGWHSVPFVPESYPDLHFLHAAARYFDMTLRRFRQKIGSELLATTAAEKLKKAMQDALSDVE